MDETQFEDMWNVMRQHNLVLADDGNFQFQCVICKKILINACTAPCRCLFCLDCINEYLENGRRKCPGQSQICNIEEIDFNSDIQVNRVINKIISKLSVKCPNVGCQSQVELNMIGDHLRICENQSTRCPYFMIGCEDVKLRNDEMSEHLSVEIHPHTKLLMNWIRNSQNETKSMKSDIGKLSTMVEKLSEENEELKAQMRRDKESIQEIRKEKESSSEINDKLRSEIERLIKNNEDLKAQTRTYKENCEKVIRELQMKEKESSTEIHRLNDEMCALKNSNRLINEVLDKLKTKNEEQVSKLNVKVQNQIKQIEQLEQEFELIESKCEGILSQSGLSHEVEIRVDKISQQCDVMKTETMEIINSIENIREIIDEKISGEFYWTIDNWAAKLNNARNGEDIKIFSDSFFTHKKGFRFCLGLMPAFDGKLWIYFQIEKGPFDDLLRWPFDRDLELSLMNSKNGLAIKTVTESTSTLTGDSYRIRLGKPKTERNNPINIFRIKHKKLTNHNKKISIKLFVKPPSIEIKTK